MVTAIPIQEARPLDDAVAACRLEVTAAPERPEPSSRLAALLLQAGRTAEALATLERAAAVWPDSAPTLLNLGVARKAAGDLTGAARALARCLILEPGLAEAHFTLGGIQQALGESAGALASLARATSLRPDWAQAWNRLGAFLQNLERLGEAETAFARAAAAAPAWHLPHHNLGQLAMARRSWPEAIAHLRAAVARDPSAASPHLDLGAMLLQEGRFAEGWQEFEWRFGCGGETPARPGCAAPVWDGSPPAGQRIVVWIEQRLGDNLQFARYAADLKRLGAEVWWQVPRPLRRLYESVPGVDRLIDDEAPVCDLQAPLMSLPRLLGTTLETIPAPVPYLAPPVADVAAARARLAGTPSGLRLGLVWASAPGNPAAARRDCGLDALLPLARIPGVTLFSLQFGERAADLAACRESGIVDLSAEVGDFARTAAFVLEMDLIVTVDTAMAHLAGALGQKVWTLLSEPADWRWLLAREDSPWYPSMRLFRQPVPGDWRAVVASVERALRQDLSKRAVP